MARKKSTERAEPSASSEDTSEDRKRAPKKAAKSEHAATATDSTEAAPKTRRGARSKRTVAPLAQRLVLARWAFDKLGWTFAEARTALARVSDMYQGGVSRFARVLAAQPPLEESSRGRSISEDEIFRIDASIRANTDRINERRATKVRWKYFQWLTLFFSELYLERWFRDPAALCAELNECQRAHNEENEDTLPEFTVEGLRRLAFWSATGSGKTLLLHMHVLQYLSYCERHRRATPNKIILVCPREELARQHLDELAQSSIPAQYFDPKVTIRNFGDISAVQVMEITRLREEAKTKTVSVSAFGEENLVFVDEAHQGLRTDDSVWKEYRDRLSAKGFAFEYSATFGQSAKSPEASDEYARCILFDYSYKRFYEDGFGKDYCILNLQSVNPDELQQRYFVGCLLSYYQQLRYFEEYGNKLAPYGVARPLWVFVGGKVTASKDDGVDLPEVVGIIASLQRVCSRPEETVGHLQALMKQRSGIVDKGERDVFAGLFPGLRGDASEWTQAECEKLYRSVLSAVFLADSPGNVHARLQKNVEHELVLSVGTSGRPFGLVYVGKVREVEKLCRERDTFGVVVDPATPGESLFARINGEDSRTHLLIGSRKFTEGWNSWRVSTLGLMNFGRTEGSQVIQLFGRGVRLRGYQGTLRRSRALRSENALPKDAPNRLPLLETLGVFGVRADYMKSFDEYLQDEGMPTQRDPAGSLDEPEPESTATGTHVVHVPIRVKVPTEPPLCTFVTDERDDLATRPRVVLDLPTERDDTAWLKKHPITLDWYPHVQSEKSKDADFSKEKTKKERVHLEARHIEWLDLDRILRGLLRQRDDHGADWCTLSVTREGVLRLLSSPSDWYQLYLPREFLQFNSMQDVSRWQAIAETLLSEYCEKFMVRWLAGLDTTSMRYTRLTPEDRNFAMAPMPDGGRGWTVTLRGDETDAQFRAWRKQYEQVAAGVSKSETWRHDQDGWMSAGVHVTDEHLFDPLLVFASRSRFTPYVAKITPVPLDASEGRFIHDLARYCEDPRNTWLEPYAIHVLRNQVKRGVSFFEANNFTPDFLLWLTHGKRQCLAVVDPKGIRNLTAINDPKFALHKLIKEREARLWEASTEEQRAGFERIVLESFIVANTRQDDVGWAEHDPSLRTLEQWFGHHVVFQRDDNSKYIDRILRKMAESLAASAATPTSE